jgi:hypothetical protein
MAQSGALPDRSSPATRPLLERTRRTARSWADSPALRESAAVWLLTRALLLLVTYVAYVLFNTVLPGGHPVLIGSHPSFLHQLLPAWDRWDARWYTDIARRGYDWKKAVGTGPAAFFPLYPLLIRAVVLVMHRSYQISALLVANVCFLGALIYLWRLSAWETSRDVAWRTILYICVFPTAFFFFAGYTESLFLLLTVAAFYHLRRREWLLAGLLAGLASATRVTGVLLALPFLYEYARSCDFSIRRAGWDGLSIALVPAGLIAFMVYLQAVVGDALALTRYQEAWQKIFTLRLWAGIAESVRQIVVVQPAASFLQVENAINLGIGLLFLVLTVFAVRRLPLSYGLYLAAFWLVTLSSPAMAGGYPVPLVSLSRYVLSLFPIFLYLGMLGARRGFHDVYLVLSVGLLAVLTAQFVTGGWIV